MNKAEIYGQVVLVHPDGIEVQKAILDGYKMECHQVDGCNYAVKRLPTDSTSKEQIILQATVVSRHFDFSMGQIVLRLELSNGELGYSIYKWAESYERDGS